MRVNQAAEMCERYRALHESGTFVLPNPWDAGSLHLLVQLGFAAVATTSSGWAWSRGARDNALTLEHALDHLRDMASASPVPVNGDFEGGFAVEPDGVARHVARAADTGVAGVSIEDATGNPSQPLFAFELAVERIRAARRALDEAGSRVVLTARTEGFIVGRPDLAETLRRLEAFAEAGADCLYAPGIRTREEIAAVVKAVSPLPVNVLVGAGFTTVAELAELGVRRISVGGALARAAWTGFMRAAQEIAEQGTFSRLGAAIPYADVNGWFPERQARPVQHNRSMLSAAVIPVLHYPDVRTAVDWLTRAFGFRERLTIGNHRAQLTFGDGAIVVAEAAHAPGAADRTHSIMVRVADVDAHCTRARGEGAAIMSEPTTFPYGERQYSAVDPGGHAWTFSQSVDDVDPASWGGILHADRPA